MSPSSLLPSLYSQGYRLNASHLGQRYSGILYRKPLATSMYRLVKWDTSAGLLDYPETVNCESDQALDVVTLNILLPVRAEIASLVASYGWTFLFELIEAATPIAEPVKALNLDGWHPVSPGTISLEAPLREKEDRILEHPRLS